MSLSVGTKIRMDGERQAYTVQAANDRFAIMTKPFNVRPGNYIYTITDLKRGVRGRCNLIFGPPCKLNNAASAAEALAMLERGEMEVTYRCPKDLTPAELKQLAS